MSLFPRHFGSEIENCDSNDPKFVDFGSISVPFLKLCTEMDPRIWYRNDARFLAILDLFFWRILGTSGLTPKIIGDISSGGDIKFSLTKGI